MNRKLIENSIKISKNLWVIEALNSKLIPFYCNQKPIDKIIVAERRLAIGDIIHSQGNRDSRFLVADCTHKNNYEEYDLLKITHTVAVQRFTADNQARDSFGRPAIDSATTIYDSVPLHLDRSSRTKPDITKDRAESDTVYGFVTSGNFALQAKDEFSLDGLTLVITAVLVSIAGITEFRAIAVA